MLVSRLQPDLCALQQQRRHQLLYHFVHRTVRYVHGRVRCNSIGLPGVLSVENVKVTHKRVTTKSYRSTCSELGVKASRRWLRVSREA